jgi:hypothetical protein
MALWLRLLLTGMSALAISQILASSSTGEVALQLIVALALAFLLLT